MWLVSKKRLMLVKVSFSPSLGAAASDSKVREIAAPILESGF
jgi:hypothetical protein